MIEETTTRDYAEEIELLKGVAMKDHSCFQEFYRRYFGVILATTMKVLQDQQDAEDVTQDVFTMLWQKAYLYEPSRGRPITWVGTLARNRAIDKLRSRQRRSRLQDDFQNDFRGRGEYLVSDSSELTQAKEKRTMLKNAILELSADQQEVINLAYFESLTQSEVAEKLGEPLGTVKARIRRGVMRLRTMVDSQD